MKVRLCEGCKHYERRTWTTRHKPSGYHTIGITHAFGYCRKYAKRCLAVKKCERANEHLLLYKRGEE